MLRTRVAALTVKRTDLCHRRSAKASSASQGYPRLGFGVLLEQIRDCRSTRLALVERRPLMRQVSVVSDE